MAADDQPWDLTQTAAPPPPPPSDAPAAGAAPIDYSAIVQRLMQQPTLPQPDTTPVKRGWLSLLGEAIGGGQTTGVMSPAQSETAGLRALRDFGTSLIAGSGYHPGQPALGAFATGFQGAEQSERGSEQGAAATLAAQQQYAAGQQQQYLARLKEALPYLTLDQQSRQAAAARALAGGGGGPAVPGTATGAGGGTYEGTIAGMEGTGKNPRSSSSGVGGFLDSTWTDFASANPDLFKGMTPAQVMAAKSDPGLGAKAITWLAQRNAGVLSDNGVTPSGPSLGIAHYVGPGPAAKIMAAPDNAPVAGFVSPQAVQANPELQTMTAGQMKQRYAGVPTPGFLKPAGGPAASAAPLPAPVKVAGPGAPTGGSTPAAPDTTPWDLPGSPAAPAAPTPPTDTTTPPPPAQPAAPTHPDIPVPGGGVISHPGEFADYRARQFVPPSGEDFNPNLAPEQQAAFNTRAQALQLKQRQAETTLLPADVPKALIDVKAEQAALAAEQQNAIAAKKLAAATATTKYNEGQQKDIQTRYDAAIAAYNTAAHTQLTGQQQTALEQQKGQNAIQLEQAKGQTADESKVMQGLDETRESARSAVDQIGIARALSQSAGDPTFWQTVQKSHPAVVQAMANSGFLSPDTVNQLGQAGALDAATNKLISMARTGSGFQRMTNMDVQILTSQAPQSVDPQQWREAKLAYLQSYMERQLHYVDAVRSLRADGTPLYQAQTKAAQDQGDVVPTIPNFTDTPQRSAVQQRIDWAQSKVPPNTFFRAPDGQLRIYQPPPAPSVQQASPQPQAPTLLRRPAVVPVN